MIGIFTLTSCGKSSTINSDKPSIKYVDIYDVVKEAFLTDNGYTTELSKHMAQEVFEGINYTFPYWVNDPEYTKPFKIDFSLQEVYQTKDKKNNLVYVDMIYSLKITDMNGKIAGASLNTPITFTVKTTNNEWYVASHVIWRSKYVRNSTINSDKPSIKYVDIYDIVKEAFVTDNGYTTELSKHMTQKVFKGINYTSYPVNDPRYAKPFKIDFSLKEVYQTKDHDLVYVDMVHSIKIIDANSKTVGGSWNAPITFTVKITDNEWYIIDKYEQP